MSQIGKHSGEKNSHFGTCWITKDGESKVIKKELLNLYLLDGWIKGRKIKNTENIKKANANRWWVNKDGITKSIEKDKLLEYLNNGWKRGRIDGYNTYNPAPKKGHYNPFLGKVLVEIDGKKEFVSKDDPRFKTGEIQPYAKDRVAVIDKDGNKFYVKTDDPRYLSGELVPLNRSLEGKVLAHDKDFNYFIVNKNDERLISGELLLSTKGFKYSDETRKKMRIHIKEYIESRVGPMRCNYSKKGCQYINELNEKYGWHLLHAENGGEFEVDGYYLDGYDKDLNIAFEYDERFHYEDVGNNILNAKDLYRQNYIINKLHCKFYRYNEKKKYFYKVN